MKVINYISGSINKQKLSFKNNKKFETIIMAGGWALD